MNTEIAKKRYKEVLRVDVTTNSQADFLATHVPFRKLHLATRLTNDARLLDEDAKRDYTEEQIYGQLVSPSDEDQFSLVIGTNGSGKSHLIRWFATALKKRADDDEAVLFVRRNDNTLKGTIKQLLDMPEIQNLPNKEQYKRLVNAASNISETELKDTLYHNYLIKIENDEGIDSDTGEHLLSRSARSNLIALMENAMFKGHLMNYDGPIERIYSKLAESDTVKESNIITEFTAEDFLIDEDFYEDFLQSEPDKKAKRIAQKLIDNGEGAHEYAEKIVKYLNSFNDEVIQRCAGLEPGDLRNIFTEIRQELNKQGKKLTILVEDITSFTGVNSALLEALMTPHTGDYEADHMCRINAIVGSTDGYYHDNFRDNYKERINHFIYVPGDLFAQDSTSLIEFFARYLNTISLQEKTVNEWVEQGALPNTYPVHTADANEYGEVWNLGNGESVSLYPFTQHAIKSLYNSQLSNKRTPRVLMQEVILPCVEEIINTPEKFPSMSINLGQTSLRATLQASGVSSDDFERLLKLMVVWGNGTTDTYEKDGVNYIGGIASPVYKRLGLPVIDGKHIEVPEIEPDNNVIPLESIDESKEAPIIDPKVQERLDNAANVLSHWADDKKMTLNFSTSNEMRDITQARADIDSYLSNEIDWLSEGVPLDAALKFIDSSNGRSRRYLVSFERQNQKSVSVITLPADNNTILLIEAFIKWRLLGNQSWNYVDSCDDMLRVQILIDQIKPQIIEALMTENNKPIAYFEYSTAAEFYRLIFNGYCKKYSDSKNLLPDLLLNDNPATEILDGHGRKWCDLQKRLNELPDNTENHKIVLQYYNLPQGTARASGNYFINRTEFDKSVRKVIRTGLHYTEADLQLDDPLTRRKKSSESLNYILERINDVVVEEKAILQGDLDKLNLYLDTTSEITSDDIKRVTSLIQGFYKQASENHLSIMNHSDTKLINNCKKDSELIASSIKQERDILETTDTVSALLKISKNPAGHLEPFLSLLEKTADDLEKAKNDIQDRMNSVKNVNPNLEEGYAKEKSALLSCEQILQEVTVDAD